MSEHDVPTVILCGGRGTRISELNLLVPKPLVPIGDRPILWHVMKIYATQGHTQFVLALGYLGEEIRRFFLHYDSLVRDFTIELGKPDPIEFLDGEPEEGWRVSCIDTGVDAKTGTRVYRATRHLDDGPIMVTYADGVGTVDIDALLAFHQGHGRLATVTAVHPPSQFGELVIESDGTVSSFAEKPAASALPINGGFMVFEQEAIDRFIPADADVMLEHEPMVALARARQLVAYEHPGFWQNMDTPRERQLLDDLWQSGHAPWKIWD
jgi:glucose-1-phosphate cytidylyltransferase